MYCQGIELRLISTYCTRRSNVKCIVQYIRNFGDKISSKYYSVLSFDLATYSALNADL